MSKKMERNDTWGCGSGKRYKKENIQLRKRDEKKDKENKTK